MNGLDFESQPDALVHIHAQMRHMISMLDKISNRLSSLEHGQNTSEATLQAMAKRFDHSEKSNSALLRSLSTQLRNLENSRIRFHTRFSDLPREIVVQIFSWIAPHAIPSLRLLSRCMQACLDSKYFCKMNMTRFVSPEVIHTGSFLVNDLDSRWMRMPVFLQESYAEAVLAHRAVLNWSGMGLSGCIPSSVACLLSLKSLLMDENRIHGSLPKSFGKLKRNLEKISAAHNEISGSIPKELSDCIKLTSLDLRFNKLSGVIPQELSRLTHLKFLHLSDNRLSGAIPASIGDLKNLEQLSLDDNCFLPDLIPSAFVNLQRLSILNLSNCRLRGPLPDWIGTHLSCLQCLNLHGNAITGSIPSSIGNLMHLRILSLGRNLLTGTLPIELGRLTQLDELHVHENRVNGTFPRELVSLVNLRVLCLRGNASLSKSIPVGIPEHSNIWRLLRNEFEYW
ncbi:hypothetical protein BJ741DRAFT_609884 [Chytriomyces cf. hyalinus JEL632]|nr:hypothetical protein BJ741DRAFT_609884 [Chytriomyces cf. hyalinus JEL632]